MAGISSKVQIFNLALNAVGTRDNITSPSENSREAEVCRLWYDAVREAVLSAARWPEVTEIDRLTLIDTQDDSTWEKYEPRPGFTYVHQLPADCLRPQYLTDYSRFDITASRDNLTALHSNVEKPILAYTKNEETISRWSPELRMGIVYGLAAHCCMPLSGKPSRTKMLIEQANMEITKARETASNIQNDVTETIPEWISARGYGQAQTTRYYYPLGGLLNLSNVN